MKIILTNFRCYINREFNIPENDITLISGQSGVGKSTIFSAIIFALFGTGNKLITQGRSTCKVELIIEKHGLRITRTKKPNRLVLEKGKISDFDKKEKISDFEKKGKKEGHTFEDAEAQVIINNIYGDTYTKTSYIDQNNANSFLLLTPMEKLKFLENFSMKDIDINSIKKKVKDSIHNFEIKYKECSSARGILEDMLKEVKVPEPPKIGKGEGNISVSNISVSNINNIKKKITSLKSNYEKCKSNIKKLTESVKNNIEAKHKLDKDLLNYNNKVEKIDSIQKDIDDYVSEINDIDKRYIGGDELVHLQEIIEEINKYKNFLLNIEKYKEKEETIKNIDKENKDKENEKQGEIEVKISSLTNELEVLEPIFKLCEDGLLTTLEKMIDIYSSFIPRIKSDEKKNEGDFTNIEISRFIYKKVKEYTDNINEYTKLLDYTKTYKCPHCSEKFCLDEDIPIKYEDDLSREESIQKYRQKFKLEDAEIDTLLKHIKKTISNYNEKKKLLSREIDELDNLIDSIWGGDFCIQTYDDIFDASIIFSRDGKISDFEEKGKISDFEDGEGYDPDKTITLSGLKLGNNKHIELRDSYKEKSFELKTLRKELEKLKKGGNKSNILQSELDKYLSLVKEGISNHNDFPLKLEDIIREDKTEGEMKSKIENRINKIDIHTENCNIEKFPKLTIITNIDDILRVLQTRIKDNTILRDKLRELKLKVKVLNGKKKMLSMELDKISVNINSINDEIEKCIKIINKNENIIKEKEKKLEIYIQKIDTFNKYENYLLKLEEYNTLEKKLEDSIQQESNMKKKYTAYMLLKDEIMKAESLSLTSLIESININANMYLEKFFPENPMYVNVLPFTETKGKLLKPQINIDIQYKGLDYDVSMLSGGELSRVIIAFTLSFAEIYNSDLILLDECTSNLDNENTTLVFNHIKETFINKTVLTIAHQVVEGNYDNIMRL